jgi:transcriptional repressor NF-X1
MLCHPGPCPPCKVILTVQCGCPRGKRRNVKCAEVGGRVEHVGAVSCGEVCGRQLGCGNPDHLCKKMCHAGECEPCSEIETAVCYCGRETKEGRCGTIRTPWIGKIGCGDDVDQLEPKDGELVMGWSCKNACGRYGSPPFHYGDLFN